MIARATMAEIDPVRMSVDDAVELFRESVVPALHEQPGYEDKSFGQAVDADADLAERIADEEPDAAAADSGRAVAGRRWSMVRHAALGNRPD